MSALRSLAVVLTAWAIIYALRALPFIVCSRSGGGNRWLKAAEKWLSPAIIALLVVYSYSGLAWRTPWPYLAGAVVVAVQLLFRNGLLSIIIGTALYMAVV